MQARMIDVSRALADLAIGADDAAVCFAIIRRGSAARECMCSLPDAKLYQRIKAAFPSTARVLLERSLAPPAAARGAENVLEETVVGAGTNAKESSQPAPLPLRAQLPPPNTNPVLGKLAAVLECRHSLCRPAAFRRAAETRRARHSV